MGRGSEIRDPENIIPDPDSWVKKLQDPGSETLVVCVQKQELKGCVPVPKV
jgi:hypothetical protein